MHLSSLINIMSLLKLLKFLSPSNPSLGKCVGQDWETLVSLVFITDSGEGRWTTEQIERKIRTNILYIIWLVFSALRLGFAWIIVPESMYWMFGNSFANAGNVKNMLGTVAGIGQIMCASYRVATVLLIRKGHMTFVRNVREMRKQRLMSLISKKPLTNIERYVLLWSVAVIRVVILTCFFILGGMMMINIWMSKSLIEVPCWIFTCLMDYLLSITVITDIFLFPALWILTACYYNR